MRITYVKRARKDQGRCGHCGGPLPAGSAYRWIKFRFGGKRKRCMKHECRFRASDMTTSDKLADIYLAQEDCKDVIEQAEKALSIIARSEEWADLLRSELEALADQLEESGSNAEDVGERYEESASNLEEYFSGSSQIDEINEKADAAREYADQLGQQAEAVRSLAFNLEGEDPEWTDDMPWPEDEVIGLLDEIRSAVDSLEMP